MSQSNQTHAARMAAFERAVAAGNLRSISHFFNPPGNVLRAERQAEIKRHLARGFSVRQVAVLTGHSRNTVLRYRKAAIAEGWKMPGRGKSRLPQ